MISQLKGILFHKSKEGLIVDVNGVGYEVMVSQMTLSRLPETGKTVTLSIHTHVTEGSFSLYGFFDTNEKELFKKLISVSGVGPRTALQILSGLTTQELIRAVINENIVLLSTINGIGRKTAERLVVELKHKVKDLIDQSAKVTTKKSAASDRWEKTYNDTLSALINLGYNRASAEKVLIGITIHPESTVEDVLKSSLGVLGK